MPRLLRPRGRFINSRRPRARSGLAALILATAALFPGAAVFAHPALLPEKCGSTSTSLATREEIEATSVILIGTVAGVGDTQARITPQVYLKGPVSASDVVIQAPPLGCAGVPLQQGERVLLMLPNSGGQLLWPMLDSPGGSYRLVDGHAVNLDPRVTETVDGAPTESEVVEHIRSVTGQYAVPATSASEGASLDWVKVVAPVTVACLLVFGIGLWLMKIWHRIDPS